MCFFNFENSVIVLSQSKLQLHLNLELRGFKFKKMTHFSVFFFKFSTLSQFHKRKCYRKCVCVALGVPRLEDGKLDYRTNSDTLSDVN